MFRPCWTRGAQLYPADIFLLSRERQWDSERKLRFQPPLTSPVTSLGWFLCRFPKGLSCAAASPLRGSLAVVHAPSWQVSCPSAIFCCLQWRHREHLCCVPGSQGRGGPMLHSTVFCLFVLPFTWGTMNLFPATFSLCET